MQIDTKIILVFKCNDVEKSNLFIVTINEQDFTNFIVELFKEFCKILIHFKFLTQDCH